MLFFISFPLSGHCCLWIRWDAVWTFQLQLHNPAEHSLAAAPPPSPPCSPPSSSLTSLLLPPLLPSLPPPHPYGSSFLSDFFCCSDKNSLTKQQLSRRRHFGLQFGGIQSFWMGKIEHRQRSHGARSWKPTCHVTATLRKRRVNRKWGRLSNRKAYQHCLTKTSTS